jgi:hypothetical protein
LIPTGAFWENQGKIQEKGKIRLFACSVRSFHHPLFSPYCATSRHVLASSCDLYFGSEFLTIANLLSIIANHCCHIVCLPIAPQILLSA